jgi:hypothetical protein
MFTVIVKPLKHNETRYVIYMSQMTTDGLLSKYTHFSVIMQLKDKYQPN